MGGRESRGGSVFIGGGSRISFVRLRTDISERDCEAKVGFLRMSEAEKTRIYVKKET